MEVIRVPGSSTKMKTKTKTKTIRFKWGGPLGMICSKFKYLSHRIVLMVGATGG